VVTRTYFLLFIARLSDLPALVLEVTQRRGMLATELHFLHVFT